MLGTKLAAVAYVRVSTDEQAQSGSSLPMQESRIRAYCKMAGLTLSAVIREEGVSAAKPFADRPGGAQLLEVLAKKRVTHIVALKLDRLFRDAADALSKIRQWDKADVALHLVDMGGTSLNTSSAMGRMMLTMLAGVAEWERNVIAERTTAVLTYKRQQRQVYSPTPYGFQRQGGDLVADFTETEVIRVMRTWRRHERWSYARIADTLNANHVPTKQERRWHASSVRYILQNVLHQETT
jgi:DNA invertase Pin-like site-specific DNA recombinase